MPPGMTKNEISFRTDVGKGELAMYRRKYFPISALAADALPDPALWSC